MLKLFRINLPKKGDRMENPGWVLTEDKSEIALASKICPNLLLWIWANIVAALKLWLVLDICRKSVLLELPSLISLWAHIDAFKVSSSLANIFHFTVIAWNRTNASIRFNVYEISS